MQLAGKRAPTPRPPYQRAADGNLAEFCPEKDNQVAYNHHERGTMRGGSERESLIINTLAATFFHADGVNLLLRH